jgi:mannosyl-oligosaccharide alpha-1,2-mannosidase
MNFFFSREPFMGLWPIRIDFSTGLFANNDFSFDAYGDSFYEYLLKLYFLTNGQCVKCRELYERAIQGMRSSLLRTGDRGTYVGNVKCSVPDDRLSYLSFFLPGMLALGSTLNGDDLQLAIKLAQTAASWHAHTQTGLMADEFQIVKEEVVITDPSFKLRPEFIESCFYLWRFTANETWRNIGWTLFESIVRNCRATHGFAALKNVNEPELGFIDMQDSYLLAETFKYAFLLFSDSELISLDEFVFTTEGHPLRIFQQDWLARHYTGKLGYRIRN